MKAVVIFNLGGPDRLENVKPFLFNLFYDRAIINISNPFRYFLAKLVSSRRNLKAQDIYQHLGGGSPIVVETESQAQALQKRLGHDYKVFIAMRYWHPMIDQVMQEVIDSKPDEIILLPLYPQFSMSTTGSFFTEWEKKMKRKACVIPIRKICCYPDNPLFTKAFQDVILNTITSENVPKNARYLFSAHGLPMKNIQAGDPYEMQVHSSVNAILQGLPVVNDHVICYQSKVGPLKWLEPSTETEIKRAAEENIPIVIIPISFVSENSETLYELDYLYKKYAGDIGMTGYYRVPTLQANDHYISALTSMVTNNHQTSCLMTGCKRFCQIPIAA
jgi:ferrochelatase